MQKKKEDRGKTTVVLMTATIMVLVFSRAFERFIFFFFIASDNRNRNAGNE